jgi:hypothetical protein
MNYLALPVSSGRFIRAIHVSNYSGIEAQESYLFHVRGHYPLGRCFPATSVINIFCNSCHTSMELLSYYPEYRSIWFGLLPFRSPLLRESREWLSIRTNIMRERKATRCCFLFLWVLRCFTSDKQKDDHFQIGFPHSDISGSKVQNHLPEAFRRLSTSFIAFISQGIHRIPFMFPVRKPEHHNIVNKQSFSFVCKLYGAISYSYNQCNFHTVTLPRYGVDLPF